MANSDKKIDLEQIKHIAELSRLAVNDEEAKGYEEQLNHILDYMDILNEVDTDNVEMTLQVTGLKNVMREDKVISIESAQNLLEVSELPKINNQIAVKAVIKED